MHKLSVFLSVYLSITLSINAQRISNVTRLTNSGTYTHPLMSPDEKHVLLTTPNFKGVYLLELATQKITTVNDQVGSGYNYCWSKDGKQIYYKERKARDYANNAAVKSFDLNQRTYETHREMNPNHLDATANAANSDEPVIYTNTQSLKIEAKILSTGKTWLITNDEGQYYNAILSHDKKMVLVHKGSDIYLYHANGSGLIKKIGSGIATAWSVDDKYIIGFLDESMDGHTINNSDLYCFDISTSRKIKMTNTSDNYEMYPSFYDNGRKILFADDKSGIIFTADIIF